MLTKSSKKNSQKVGLFGSRHTRLLLFLLLLFVVSTALFVVAIQRVHALEIINEESTLLQASRRNMSIFWFEADSVVRFLGGHILKTPHPCPVQCDFHINKNRLNESDAVIFHLPTFRKLPKEKREGQSWVLFCMESSSNYPRLADKEFRSHFDLHMSYRWDSDIITGYWSGKLETYFRPPTPKTAEAPVVFINSNCDSLNNREAFVQDLMQYIKVDSYGKCLHNRDFPEADKGGRTKLETIGKYLFVLTFENSNGEDYVSEKIFHAFHVGSVPVYLGAPNIDKFLPDPLAAIKVSDFRDAKSLAEHLLFLKDHPEEYARRLKWKTRPPSESFRKLVELQKYDSRCRLCNLIHQRKSPKSAD